MPTPFIMPMPDQCLIHIMIGHGRFISASLFHISFSPRLWDRLFCLLSFCVRFIQCVRGLGQLSLKLNYFIGLGLVNRQVLCRNKSVPLLVIFNFNILNRFVFDRVRELR